LSKNDAPHFTFSPLAPHLYAPVASTPGAQSRKKTKVENQGQRSEAPCARWLGACKACEAVSANGGGGRVGRAGERVCGWCAGVCRAELAAGAPPSCDRQERGRARSCCAVGCAHWQRGVRNAACHLVAKRGVSDCSLRNAACQAQLTKRGVSDAAYETRRLRRRLRNALHTRLRALQNAWIQKCFERFAKRGVSDPGSESHPTNFARFAKRAFCKTHFFVAKFCTQSAFRSKRFG